MDHTSHTEKNRSDRVKRYIRILLMFLMFFLASCRKKDPDTLTYTIFPYIPQADHYQEVIERRWAQIEPDIRLVRAEWNCYHDEKPEGIDVLMYDELMQDKLIENGWIQPIDLSAVKNIEDIFPFALKGLMIDKKLYGIPVVLCGNFLIYDQDCIELSDAQHLSDLADEAEILVINTRLPSHRTQYINEIMADISRQANPIIEDDDDDLMALMDQLAVDDHEKDEDAQVAAAYDSGIGKGYIGFSESLALLNKRIAKTTIKAISFSDQDDLPRLYVDAVALNSEVKGRRYEKCIELMNVIAEAEVLLSLSVQDEVPKYLMLARRSPYDSLNERFPLYVQIEKLASDEDNQAILAPRP